MEANIPLSLVKASSALEVHDYGTLEEVSAVRGAAMKL